MKTVAVLTTHVASHELYRIHGEYRVITTVVGREPSDLERHEFGRPLSIAEAGEWIEAAKAGGGYVCEEVRP